ncbi:multiubiquitin domain-containing protein [Bradyrhizobium algeriense]|uniref:multiubiquitin domain-containing protein n=1 Tax=Bradyrhizobium algeriense TaxID=634784 RepID=UPI000D38DA81|nr:multiubiquitin domain-containing protein [Bradyrhizobium algeriense]
MSDHANLAGPDAAQRQYETAINDTLHSFRDPVVTGEQILETAKLFPTDEYLIFLKLQDGQLDEIRLDETVDLRTEGIERFITFKSDRSFRFTLDGRRFEWGLPFITGLQLKRLAGVDPKTYGVWLAQRVGDDRLIGNTEQVDLRAEGVERFFTGIDTTTEGAGPAVLPPDDREYLENCGIVFEERNEGGVKALVLKGRSLPSGRFDSGVVDILIVLPPAYPDCAPDMFYLTPWVRLVTSKRYPQAADQPYAFAGRSWQRWSRHNTAWRPGVDGIWTMLRRIERALEIAA